MRGSVTDAHKERWLDSVLEEIRNFDKDPVADQVYIKVYANTPEGHAEGARFMAEEIKQ